MALTIQTNVSSLNSQRNLSTSQTSYNKALQRLSSGLRINSAADDAAGLAISTSLTSQVKGLNQAIRNAGDGLSLLGTAEGGIVEQQSLLQRMRELAVQSASDTNSAINRTSLNDEVTALKSEFDRIAQTSQFNGINLLDGSFSNKEVQIGADTGANQRISVSIASSRSSAVGSIYKTSGAAGGVTNAGLTAAGQLTITTGGTATNVGATSSDGVSSTGGTSSALAYANAINAVTSQTGVTASATTSVTGGAVQAAGSIDATTNTLTINGTVIGAATLTAASGSQVADAINASSGTTGVTASVNSANKLVLTAADGRNIDVAVAGTAGTTTGLSAATTRGDVSLSSVNGFSLTGASVAALNQASTTATLDTTKNVSTIDISSKSGANTALQTIDAALSHLNTRRSALGAQTNRLNSVINNLSTASENASASNSRIQDADFASETANLTRGQILQQAGISVLSQANQSPQLALSLLQ